MSAPLAVIADIHGNSAALDAVLADIAAQGIEDIVNLGDVLSGPLDPAGTAERLMPLGLPTVRGNHDRWLLEGRPGGWEDATLPHLTPDMRDWLSTMPPCLYHHERIFLCHATPADDLAYWLHRATSEGHMRPATREEAEAPAAGIDCPVLLCGHTHLRAAVRLRDGRLVVNPGSVGIPGYRDDLPVPHRVEAGTPQASYAVLSDGAAGWSVAFRLVPYDATAMVALARKAGYDDLANVIATGFLDL